MKGADRYNRRPCHHSCGVFMFRPLLVLLLAVLVAACGQKGPLYMPAKPPAPEATAPAAPATEEKKDEEKKDEAAAPASPASAAHPAPAAN